MWRVFLWEGVGTHSDDIPAPDPHSEGTDVSLHFCVPTPDSGSCLPVGLETSCTISTYSLSFPAPFSITYGSPLQKIHTRWRRGNGWEGRAHGKAVSLSFGRAPPGGARRRSSARSVTGAVWGIWQSCPSWGRAWGSQRLDVLCRISAQRSAAASLHSPGASAGFLVLGPTAPR